MENDFGDKLPNLITLLLLSLVTSDIATFLSLLRMSQQGKKDEEKSVITF